MHHDNAIAELQSTISQLASAVESAALGHAFTAKLATKRDQLVADRLVADARSVALMGTLIKQAQKQLAAMRPAETDDGDEWKHGRRPSWMQE